jgi:hypothetical protein
MKGDRGQGDRDTGELVPFKVVCRRLGIHPNSGYKYRREDRFPLEVIELGDRYYCRAADLDLYTRARAAI